MRMLGMVRNNFGEICDDLEDARVDLPFLPLAGKSQNDFVNSRVGNVQEKSLQEG